MDPYKLLRNIRRYMAQDGGAQERLDGLVQLIAKTIGVDVCSIYLQQSNRQMELSATHGLSLDAVHNTRLSRGEGLIGEVVRFARPLNIQDAPNHPRFSYRPETSEDPYSTFLGVPILRGGRVLGVLSIQSIKPQQYGEDIIEALQTVAMVLAEIIVSFKDSKQFHIKLEGAERITGQAYAEGLVMGEAILHDSPVSTTQLIADDLSYEEHRLEAALQSLRHSIDGIIKADVAFLTGPTKEILETYRMFAHDRGWVRRLVEAVRSGLTAEAAVDRVRAEHRARLMKAHDPYLRARLHDLEELANRLLHHLQGGDAHKLSLPENAVLIARNISPTELLDYDRDRLKGLALEEGEPASHTSIIARALGVPLVGRLEGALDRIESGDRVILDAKYGVLHIRPDPSVMGFYQERFETRGRRLAEFEKLKDVKTQTKDGHKITLMLNVGLEVDLQRIQKLGIDGIGLFRTEFQFMVSETLPKRDAQVKLYRHALEAAKGSPVIFRTLDLGGDKILPHNKTEREDNPALGWRAIRMGLDRPGLLRYQLRALITASENKPLYIMFPMIATVEEFEQAKHWLMHEIRWTKKRGLNGPEFIRTGAMIETPSIGWMIEDLLEKADFVSLGTNDLKQYFFAADRGNLKVSDRYDGLHPGFLSFLKSIVDAGKKHGKLVSVCGEMASHPVDAAVLLALGCRSLSISSNAIGPVKRLFLELNITDLQKKLAEWINQNCLDIRTRVIEYLEYKT